jgi:hypothetical protein
MVKNVNDGRKQLLDTLVTNKSNVNIPFKGEVVPKSAAILSHAP